MKISNITYAGHSSLLVGTDMGVVGIDPWLEGNPRCPAELQSPETLSLIALTHGHADHASDSPALAKQHGCPVAATYELAMLMIAEGVSEDKVLPMNKGGTIEYNGLKVTLTHALHSSSFDTAAGPVYAGEACGVVMQADNATIFHAGDTCLFSDLSLIGERYKPDIAFLPIGDCFTMGPVEAAKAAKLLACKLAIPIHWGTFPLLTGTPEEFVAQCAAAGVESLVLQPGEVHSIS